MLTRLFALLLALGCLAVPVSAAEVDCGSVYCFTPGDFGEDLTGICITQVPESGAMLLDTRVLRPGDILTADQVAAMTFAPAPTETDTTAQVGYLPIFDRHVEGPAVMTLGIRGREDKAPVAEDAAFETYKNLEITQKLKVSDPEGQPMTYTVTRQPKRGTVTIGDDGSFTYSPKKNKVGVDSFVFTAADPAGKVSREATVTVTILKPSDALQYTDTAGHDCRFEAEWMRHTGIFTGESLAENPCFAPDREVTRGEFVTMLVKALDIPREEDLALTGYTDEIPGWVRPYLAAAVRSGITAGLPDQEVFGADVTITEGEAGLLLRSDSGASDAPLTRAAAAKLLYEAARQAKETDTLV